MRGKIIRDDGQQANLADINREVGIEHALGPRLDIDIIDHAVMGVGLPFRMRSRMVGTLLASIRKEVHSPPSSEW